MSQSTVYKFNISSAYGLFVFNREEAQVVCVSQEVEESDLEIPQSVSVSWITGYLPDRDTGFFFIYKPDPEIQGIHPDITILRQV